MAQNTDPTIEALTARADALEARRQALDALRKAQQALALAEGIGLGMAFRPVPACCPPEDGPNTYLGKAGLKSRINQLEIDVKNLLSMIPATMFRTISERYEGPEVFDNTVPGWVALYSMVPIVTTVAMRFLVRGLLTYRSSNSGTLDNMVSLRCLINSTVVGKASEGRPAKTGTVNGQIEVTGLSAILVPGSYTVSFQWQVNVQAQSLSFIQLQPGNVPPFINGLDAIVQQVPPI